ncbi:MAG: S8 family peptidase [Methylococcaceae bacterium]|nr:S8 family peptidase [Methylococcaceae bacterium]
MAKKQTEKRYIVTFLDPETDQSSAAAILDVASDVMQDGVSLLATAAKIDPPDVLHFNGLGSTSMTLSDAEADRFRNDKRVLAVEDDIEMHILNDHTENWAENLFNPASQEGVFEQYYQQGYRKGISDLYIKFLKEAKDLYGIDSVVIPSANTSALPQPIPWNIKLVNAPQAWARGFRGDGVKVAVLDTGIANHPDLVISGGVSFVPGVVSFNDGNSHGTHCAGIIAARNNAIGVVGVAPMARLYAVKVLNDAGSGQTSWILAGMAWARQRGMKVVSMSLGSDSCPSVAYTNAIAQLNAAGVTVVCAAGNSGRPTESFRCVGSPANSPRAIAVAAVNSNKVRADFSSFGITCCPPGANPVTISAPGVSVNSTIPGGYGVKSGTSMACPHVAGAAALVNQRFPTFTPAQISARLRATASDLGVPGNDPFYGSGLVNCNTATL